MTANIELTQAILNQLFIGNSVSSYDSWNGSHDYIENVKKVREGKDSIICTGIGSWNNEKDVYLPKKILGELLSKGEVTVGADIDHCYVHQDYTYRIN